MLGVLQRKRELLQRFLLRICALLTQTEGKLHQESFQLTS